MRAVSAMVAAAAAALCLAGASALPLSLLRHKNRAMLEERQAAAASLGGMLRLPQTQYFTQKTDHFDWTTETWQQRYWVNATFCADFNKGCPIFLYIGGEASESAYSAVAGEHVELAAQNGAYLATLEHRFYGGSLPKPDLTVDSLRLLSSQQALADLSAFVQALRVQTGLTDAKTSPLVTFGGSYPGALSAWARLKYPHVVHAAVSTSSPVRAEVDYYGYCEVVADALLSPIAGGSQKCYDATRAAFSQMHDRLNGSPQALAALSKQLHSCKPIQATENDRFAAMSAWAGEVMGLVQYNRLVLPKDSPRLNVERYCQNMTAAAKGEELASLATLLTASSSSCMQNTWAEQMVELDNTQADPQASGVGIRQWVWQTATQFAYYQGCNTQGSCPFAADMDIAGFGRQTEEAFGVPLQQTREAVDFTEGYYGSNTTAADRTFFVNGGLDPWHVLSVQRDLPQWGDVRSVVIDGTSHCRQMSPSSPTDPKQVVEAREKVAQAISEWLA